MGRPMLPSPTNPILLTLDYSSKKKRVDEMMLVIGSRDRGSLDVAENDPRVKERLTSTGKNGSKNELAYAQVEVVSRAIERNETRGLVGRRK